MRKFILFITIIITLVISCKDISQLKHSENTVKNRLQSYLEECNKNGLSASILVAKDGEILYSGEVGLRNKSKKLPVTKETIFTTGSLTKQFTATAILKLQEEGKLSVYDSIYNFF